MSTPASVTPAALASVRATRDTRVFRWGLALALSGAAVALILPLTALLRWVPRSYNEGWNAYWAQIALQGGTLYQSADSLIVNNYPPLSFYLVGWLGGLLGDDVIAGRLVSLASLGVIVISIHRWLRAGGVAPRAALAGAVFCLMGFATFGRGHVAINDPQLLAHAFTLAGLALLWQQRFSRSATLTASLLMLAGGFTKHLVLPVPVITTVWLARWQRRRLALWLLAGALGLALGCWLTVHFGGPRFLPELLSARAWSWAQVWVTVFDVCKRLWPLLALSTVAVVRVCRGAVPAEAARFVWPYLALSFVLGALARGGDGVARNGFFDFMIAASMGAALGVQELLRMPGPVRLRGVSWGSAAMLAIGLFMAVGALNGLPRDLREIRDLDATEEDTRRTVREIARLGGGGAACEMLQLCYWAHVPFTVDFFNYGQKLKIGLVPVSSCMAAVHRGAFPVLQLQPPAEAVDRLGRCADVIPQDYTVILQNRVGRLLVPSRSAGEPAALPAP